MAGGPDATISFNLANLLYSQERRAEATERFWQAVETDPSFAEAWNNLGIVLDELGQPNQAITALRRVLDIRPDYADAHYNLADTLDQLGCESEARMHWRQYLEV